MMRLGDHEPFRTSDLVDAAERFREMHAASGEVGGAEVRLVLTEKDVARMRGRGRGKCTRRSPRSRPRIRSSSRPNSSCRVENNATPLTRLVRKTLGGHPYGDTNR